MFKWLSNLFGPKKETAEVAYKVEPVKVEEVQPTPEPVYTPEVKVEPVVQSKPKKITRKKAELKTVEEKPAKTAKEPKIAKTVPAMKVTKPRAKKAN